MLKVHFSSRRGPILIGLAAAASIAIAIAIGAVAVYVNSRDAGNATQLAAHQCSDALGVAALLEPQIRGDLAAFRAADEPDLLTDLVFKASDQSDTGIEAFGGKTVLLNLWATWCGPCRAEMPSLDRLQAELGGDRFEVVAVNIDTAAPERALDFLDEIGVGNLTFLLRSQHQDLQRPQAAGPGSRPSGHVADRQKRLSARWRPGPGGVGLRRCQGADTSGDRSLISSGGGNAHDGALSGAVGAVDFDAVATVVFGAVERCVGLADERVKA